MSFFNYSFILINIFIILTYYKKGCLNLLFVQYFK